MISGKYTVAELRDLLKAKDADLTQLEAAWRAFDKTWMSYDSAADNAWMADFNALKQRYGAARAAAGKVLALADPLLNSIGEAFTPADAEYRGLLRALQKTDGVVSAGDLQDLYLRLQTAMNQHAASIGQPAPAPISPTAVQPTALDPDLLKIQVVNAATDPIVNQVNAAMASAGLAVGGHKVPDHSTRNLLLAGGGITLAALAALKLGRKAIWPF